MELLKRISQILKKPYPLEESRAIYFRYIALVSLFVTFFLYIFQPFDISNAGSDLFMICLGFGLMTFISSVVYDFVINAFSKYREKTEKYTFGKWIFYITGLMLCISLANFLFVRSLMGSVRWEFLPDMIYGTFAVGIFPTVLIGGISLLRQERKYQNIADQINQNQSGLALKSINKEVSIFEIPLGQIRYVEALQNYVKIGFINKEGQLKEKTVRATLKKVLDQTSNSSIVKCHRSFLVNQEAILSTTGNAQGLILTLSDCSRKIPVSRSYVSVFRTY